MICINCALCLQGTDIWRCEGFVSMHFKYCINKCSPVIYLFRETQCLLSDFSIRLITLSSREHRCLNYLLLQVLVHRNMRFYNHKVSQVKLGANLWCGYSQIDTQFGQ